ncbi:MAG: hypothetical protein AAB875_01275, partial [Patescibacteria group bacterium]
MARRARKKPDELLAPEIAKKVLKLLTGLMVLVGKPLFFVLTRIIIALLFIAYVIGHTARILIEKVLGTAKALKKLRIKPKLRIPKAKLPKIELKPSLALLFLKTRLLLLRFKLPKIKAKAPPRLASFLVFIFFLAFVFWLVFLKDLPSPKTLLTREQEVSTKIYDRNGVLLYKIYEDENRTPVTLSSVPLH